MSHVISLGSLRLSCPSTGLDLALTSNAHISTLARPCSDTPSITDIESGRVWLAPNTNVKLLLAVTWPSTTLNQRSDALRKCLITALQNAALWRQLSLQPSLTVEPSQCSNTRLLVISLTSAPSSLPIKKQSAHRLGTNVPSSHVKPPDGLPHWTLDQVQLSFDIASPTQFTALDTDLMLFENSTLLEDQVNMNPASSAKILNPEQIVGAIDVALRLALTNLPPRALSGFEVTEKASFKHLDDICPALWSPGHIEALASRAVFLPTISHAISNAISQRARSFSLREKLKEIALQEHLTASSESEIEPQAIQKAVSIRLWRLMQRRLRDPSAAKKLQSVRTSDAIPSTSEQDEDVFDILSFEPDDNHAIYPQLETCLESDDEVDGEELLDVEYESEWEDLFTNSAAEHPVDDDEEMLDCLRIAQHDDYDEDMFSGDLEDDISSALEEMLEL